MGRFVRVVLAGLVDFAPFAGAAVDQVRGIRAIVSPIPASRLVPHD